MRDRAGLQGAWRAGYSADVGIERRGGRRVSGSAFEVEKTLEAKGGFLVVPAGIRGSVPGD